MSWPSPAVSVTGIGLHSGLPCRATVLDAPCGSGIVFCRAGKEIPARIDFVDRNADLTSRLGLDGASVGMVEHLLAALGALGIGDAVIEVEGPEIPALDGSARGWIEVLGERRLDSLWFVDVDRPIVIQSGASSVEMRPLAPGQQPSFELEIDFAHRLIGRRHFAFRPLEDSFETMVAPARTFGFETDVDRLHRDGLALGGSLENAVIFSADGIVGSEPLRFEDEPVRHKMLDLLGDLMLLGAWPHAVVKAVRPGHRLIHELCAAARRMNTRRFEIERRVGARK